MAPRPSAPEADLDAPFAGLRYEKAGRHRASSRSTAPSGATRSRKPMERRCRAIWTDVRDDPAVRVAIVGAAGERHFCTGFDVRGRRRGRRASSNNRPLDQAVLWSPHQNRVWKPVICA